MTEEDAISLVSQATKRNQQRWQKEGWRRGAGSNRRIKVLQTYYLSAIRDPGPPRIYN